MISQATFKYLSKLYEKLIKVGVKSDEIKLTKFFYSRMQR